MKGPLGQGGLGSRPGPVVIGAPKGLEGLSQGADPSRLRRRFHCSNLRALWGTELAWASMAVPAWTRMLALAYWVLSSATSTSWMRELAAERFSLLTVSWSALKLSRAW